MTATITPHATMRAVVATPGGGHRTERRTVPVPAPAAGEVLVAVRAFSLNRGELALLGHRAEGWRPGQDLAGEVAAVGDGVHGVAVGERVAALVDGAGWSEYAVAPAERLAAVPASVGFEQAAALPMAGTTALNLIRRGGSMLGRRALVTGASGGVGGLAVQLLARSGARVVALARPAQGERLTALGAERVVGALEEEPAPFDLVLESVGGPTLGAALARIAPGATIVLFGNSSGEPTPIDLFGFAGGGEDARLETYFSHRHAHAAGANLAILLELLERRQLQVPIGLQEHWDELEAALDALARRKVAGKAVLTVA